MINVRSWNANICIIRIRARVKDKIGDQTDFNKWI